MNSLSQEVYGIKFHQEKGFLLTSDEQNKRHGNDLRNSGAAGCGQSLGAGARSSLVAIPGEAAASPVAY